ncbi:MAG: hypothetical protein U0800_07480 [Isosphaeraceae bacterium]
MSPDPIALRNAANAQFSTGPRTAEGKAVSSGNATVHGFCSVEPRTPEDRTEAAALYSMLAAELKPVTPMEIEAVRDAAFADQRRRRLGRALEDCYAASADSRREGRREEVEADRDRCQAEVDFWRGLLDHPPEVGRGLETGDWQAVMTRFGPSPGFGPNRGGAIARRIRGPTSSGSSRPGAQGGARAPRGPGQSGRPEGGGNPAEADSRAIERSRKACEGLADLFRQCLASANEALARATDRAEKNRAQPSRVGDWFDDSKRAQLLLRYQGEATRDYYRALRSFDAVRRRQDAERRQKEREERQARKAARDAEKAAQQAARQAEIDAKATPQRDELTARVVEPFVAQSPIRNEPRSAAGSSQTCNPNPVASGPSSPTPLAEGPRVVHRRGRAVFIDPRRPPERR